VCAQASDACLVGTKVKGSLMDAPVPYKPRSVIDSGPLLDLLDTRYIVKIGRSFCVPSTRY